MGAYKNEIERFVYEKCYNRIWEKVSLFVSEHPYQLDLTYLRVKYPDAAVLGDMILEYTTNIRVKEDYLLFDAVVSCTINLTGESDRGSAYCDISQWLEISCDAVITDKVEALDVVSVSRYTGNHVHKPNTSTA